MELFHNALRDHIRQSANKLGVRSLDQEGLILVPDLTLEEGQGLSRPQCSVLASMMISSPILAGFM